jgi:hypothetical protein
VRSPGIERTRQCGTAIAQSISWSRFTEGRSLHSRSRARRPLYDESGISRARSSSTSATSRHLGAIVPTAHDGCSRSQRLRRAGTERDAVALNASSTDVRTCWRRTRALDCCARRRRRLRCTFDSRGHHGHNAPCDMYVGDTDPTCRDRSVARDQKSHVPLRRHRVRQASRSCCANGGHSPRCRSWWRRHIMA